MSSFCYKGLFDTKMLYYRVAFFPLRPNLNFVSGSVLASWRPSINGTLIILSKLIQKVSFSPRKILFGGFFRRSFVYFKIFKKIFFKVFKKKTSKIWNIFFFRKSLSIEFFYEAFYLYMTFSQGLSKMLFSSVEGLLYCGTVSI